MFPVGYWTPRYWTGRYWPPTGAVVVVRVLDPLWSSINSDSLVAVLSLDNQLGAILTASGVVGARFEINVADAEWIAGEAPPSALLVRNDIWAATGTDALAVQMPVLYVTSEIVSDLLESKLEDEAIISVVSPEGQSVTLKS